MQNSYNNSALNFTTKYGCPSTIYSLFVINITYILWGFFTALTMLGYKYKIYILLTERTDIMNEKINKKKAGSVYQQYHIDVLDGIRAVTITIIVWFHFWQQTWIMPIWGKFNIDWIPRSGSICVDMMILLSGFCLFLPYARQMVYGTETVSAKEFYIKRAARIMP